MTNTGNMAKPHENQNPDWYIRRDAIARQTAAWLFTLSEDANEAISHLVDQLCRRGLAQLLWQIRNDTYDESEDDGSKYRVGWNHGARHSAWMLLGLDRNEIERLIEAAENSAPADTVVPHDGERTHGGNLSPVRGLGRETAGSPAPAKRSDSTSRASLNPPRAGTLSAAGRHGAVGEPQTSLDPGHETPTGGDSHDGTVREWYEAERGELQRMLARTDLGLLERFGFEHRLRETEEWLASRCLVMVAPVDATPEPGLNKPAAPGVLLDWDMSDVGDDA